MSAVVTTSRNLMCPLKRCMSKFLNLITDIDHFKTPIPKKYRYLPIPLYGGKYTITLLPGNGVGYELTQHVIEVLKEARSNINLEEVSFPKSNLDIKRQLNWINSSIRRNRVALKSCMETDNESGGRNQHIRSELDLYISIVHAKSFPNVDCLKPEIDIILARQATEGEYLMLEHETVKGHVGALKVITYEKTRQYARWALIYAKKYKRKKVTVVHKRDVYSMADGLFVSTIEEQMKYFNNLKFETMRLSPFIEKLMKHPEELDFVMVPNLYGCVATHIVSGLIGGMGLLSKKSYSNYYAMFEPAVGTIERGSIKENSINPVAMLNSLVDMLSYLKMNKDARTIDYAVKKTLCTEKIQTSDIGGTATTSEFIDRVKYYVRKFN